MPEQIILASGSSIRATLLSRAGVTLKVAAARVDEDAIKSALESEGETPRTIADALAEAKSCRVSPRYPEALTIGADQVLELDGRVMSKPADRSEAERQLTKLSGRKHKLHSAAVIAENGRPVWRHVSSVTLEMRALSRGFLESYLDRNWPGVADSVGAYKIEEEGIRLFSRISGDYFAILGLPLTEILSYLTVRGVLET